MAHTTTHIPAPTASYAGSNSERQSTGLPGHCENCAEFGHVAAHRDLGCGDVGCHRSHGPEDEPSTRPLLFITGPHLTGVPAEHVSHDHDVVRAVPGQDARDLIGSCSLLLADVSTPSTTTGLHIAHARTLGIPTVLAFAAGSMPDAEVLEAGTEVIIVSTPADLRSPELADWLHMAMSSVVTEALRR